MSINRDNYEEFFILYIDKELNATDRALVEAFVEQNPDLKSELEMLQQTILPMDKPVIFLNKESLFRNESAQKKFAQLSNELINELNCEEYFVLYADNELNNTENALVEEFIYSHPQYQEHFELIQQVKFQPEKNIVFSDKSVLYRSENDHKVVPMFTRMRSWKMVAAAAVLLMISGTVWYTVNNRSTDPSQNVLANNDKPAQKNLPAAKKTNKKSIAPAPEDNNQVNLKKTQQLPVTEKTTGADKLKVTEPIINNNDIAVQNNHKKTDASNKAKEGVIKEGVIKFSTAEADQSAEKLFAQAPVKKDKKESNIINGSNVEQQRNIDMKVAEIKVPVVEDKAKLDESMAVVENQKTTAPDKAATTPVEKNSISVFSNLSNEDEEIFEPSEKKNRNRGFFRKVTRVFDKVTSKEPAENRRGLHIASFAIALK